MLEGKKNSENMKSPKERPPIKRPTAGKKAIDRAKAFSGKKFREGSLKIVRKRTASQASSSNDVLLEAFGMSLESTIPV